MEPFFEYFKGIIDSDNSQIVVCNTEHKIIYMNPTAIRSYGELVGKSILNCHNEKSRKQILKVFEWFSEAYDNNRVHTFFNEDKNKDVYMVAIRNESGKLIGYYEKHETRTRDGSPLYSI